MARIVGRKNEVRLLQNGLDSNKSELIAVYGRRRVGKTFLIRECYKQHLFFEVTGLFNGTMKDQLYNFSRELLKTGNRKQQEVSVPSGWLEAFSRLEEAIGKSRSKKKKVIFLDEFPWMATAKSGFLTAFENFWNHYCTRRNDLIVVICGSAASYMVQKIVNNRGGLHNRITQKIRLMPFDVSETEQFLRYNGIRYTRYDIVQLYMAVGGIPHYLDKIEKGLSAIQNIDRLCFEKDGVLVDEFDRLFRSLFDNSEKYLLIVRALSGFNSGITRQELIDKSGISGGGDFSWKLTELIESGFVSESPFYKNKKQLALYRLSDEYCRFYLKFIQHNRGNGQGTWQRLFKSQSYISWSGFSFENLCLKHIRQIKNALRIDAIYSLNSSWFNSDAQIDMLIDRDDNIINICEMKFYNTVYTIDKKVYKNLLNKIEAFQAETHTRKNIFLVMITTHGIKANEYSNELVQNSLDLNSLFVE